LRLRFEPLDFLPWNHPGTIAGLVAFKNASPQELAKAAIRDADNLSGFRNGQIREGV